MNTPTDGDSKDPEDVPPVAAYGDPHRTGADDGNGGDGPLRPDAPMPGWIESFGRKIERAIHNAMVFEQHEYLEHRRLPHTVRTWEIKTVPWLLEDGYILALTEFPIATETCCVVAFTPVYADGRTAMARETAAEAMALEVVDYEVFAYQERSRTAYENTRMILGPPYIAELKRQAFALELQYIQFFYFTQFVPKVREAFEDPNGYLELFLARAKQAFQSSCAQPHP
ncbi:hypothetical protein [Paraburkholderia adhaesiva]|uniref:hypothetical protein n=1 Tax=Paraburkholderia adhaesiva TaxID=2883244 RepID=UPI001F45871E|nr:hypothetical protein [Paraburkholderia adhaesiva]